jgi:diguanylate cyclase (GGDEF)-like protein
MAELDRNTAKGQTVRRTGLRRTHAISIGFVLLWLVGAVAIVQQSQQASVLAVEKLRDENTLETRALASKLAGKLSGAYVTLKTISLLPAVRAAAPQNRSSDQVDVVQQGRFSAAGANTIQQLYNHIASELNVSEVYVVYDGFKPKQGEVPFLMFDEVLLQRITKRKETHATHEQDIPEEEESFEYDEYVRQLSHLHQRYSSLPETAPTGIGAVTSSLMRTCDNSQFTSTAHGNVRDTFGLLLSVPIYDLTTDRFKGLVTAVIRANVLEAALIGWPLIPVSADDRDKLSQSGIDLASPPAEYVLVNQDTGDLIMDRRNTVLPQFVNGLEQAGLHDYFDLALPYATQWRLHRYTSAAKVDALTQGYRSTMWQRLGLLSLLLIPLWLAVARVFAEQRRSSYKLRKLANIDELTGLPNRRMVGASLPNAIDKELAAGRRYAVLMIDLDGFKAVNDTMGHHAGDQLLIEVARRFESCLRSSDQLSRVSAQQISNSPMVARLGGDEFLVMLPEAADINQASRVATRLHDSLNDPVYLAGESVTVRASIGIAVSPEHGVDNDTLLRNADLAMYQAKSLGQGQTVYYDQHIGDESLKRLKMLADLQTAQAQAQFVLHYQPELSLQSGQVNCVEALLRWQHPTLGLIAPATFIPLLEQSGQIREVGQWVIETACQQLKQWQDEGSSIRFMAINLSPRQLTIPDFASTLVATLSRIGVAPEAICLELTESVLMQQIETSIQLLQQLRDAGIKVAIDDFGTGFSSLSYLRKLPLDILKIDRSFVNDSHTEDGAAICDMLTVLARRLGLALVAEGIETPDQLERMRALGCDWVQGYWIAKPLPAAQAAQFARSFNEAALDKTSQPQENPKV